MLNFLISKVKGEIFRKESPLGKSLCQILSNPALGMLALKLSLFSKRLSNLRGGLNQRVCEYPWVLRQLRRIKSGGLVLDVGCAVSLFSSELVLRGFRVVGVDINYYSLHTHGMMFVKSDLRETCFRSNVFDAIVMVSTIEHVGLDTYGQRTVNGGNGDIKAVNELRRILKPKGLLILTTPYIGDNPLHVTSEVRWYNRRRLEELTSGFEAVEENYFYPNRTGKRLDWVKMNREDIDQMEFNEEGLACLVLKKP